MQKFFLFDRRIIDFKKENMEFEQNFLNCLKQSKKNAIITHNLPDGDAVGSAVAIQLILKQQNISSQIVFTEPMSVSYDYLDLEYILLEKSLLFDNIVVLDTQESTLLLGYESLFLNAKNVFVIDHHPAGPNKIEKATFFVKQQCSCTGEIVDLLFDEIPPLMETEDKKLYAKAIYTSILYDTNGFANLNTTGNIFYLCSKLCTYGLNPAEVHNDFLLKKPFSHISYLGYVLGGAKLFANGKIALITSLKKESSTFGVDSKNPPSSIGFLKGAIGVEIFIHLKQIKECEFRVSLRSDVCNVKNIANAFNGGGHKRAAGFTISLSLEETIKRVVNICSKQLERN